jgi:Holliday junction DNA helicase RuvA
MFYSIKGKVLKKGENYLVLGTNNISYQIFVTDFLLDRVKIGEEKELLIFLYLKEETIELYGFTTEEELFFFKELNAIPNIGPKSALSILSAIKIKDLKEAILNEDETVLVKVSGIGKKTANRIIMEMKSRISKLYKTSSKMKESDAEVIEALVKLGYSLKEARTAVLKLPDDIKGTKERLKEALKIIANQMS